MRFGHAPIALMALGLLMGAGASRAESGVGERRFHHDHVLGTSLDLVVMAETQGAAALAERAALDEVERLRKILSTYNPASEISRLRPGVATRCSGELVEVLSACLRWHERSGGAFNAQLGAIIDVWRDAHKRDRLPDREVLAGLVARVNRPAFEIHATASTVKRLNDLPLNIDAVAKGYILDKALGAVRQVAGVRGAMLDIGGEVACFGMAPGGEWRVGVANPADHADNARPVALIRIDGRAVATSGAYERFYTIGGRHYSHILDPHTGMPAEGVASATVIAPNCADADALATILCVLKPRDGIKLVESLRTQGQAIACMLVLPDGSQLSSDGWEKSAVPQPMAEAAGNPNWPRGHQLTISLGIARQAGRRTHRPYVAIWIEDAKGAAVRTIQVWGREPKYLKDLPRWWAIARDNRALVQSVTRATRAPGRYELVWDGLDDKGRPVAAGTYTVRIEAKREKGTHALMETKIECGGKPASATIAANREMEAAQLKYGPREAKP